MNDEKAFTTANLAKSAIAQTGDLSGRIQWVYRFTSPTKGKYVAVVSYGNGRYLRKDGQIR